MMRCPGVRRTRRVDARLTTARTGTAAALNVRRVSIAVLSIAFASCGQVARTPLPASPRPSRTNLSGEAKPPPASWDRALEVVAPSAKAAWVVTSAGVEYTGDGAETWQKFPLPGIDSNAYLDGRLAARGATAWFVALPDEPAKAVVYRMQVAPRHVTQYALPQDAQRGDAASVSFVDDSHGWVSVRGNSQRQRTRTALYATSDGGASWARVSGDVPFDGNVALTGPNEGWGLGSTLYRTHDGGKSWHATHPPTPSNSGLTPRFVSAAQFGDEEIVGIRVSTGMRGYAIFDVTKDDGATWVRRDAPADATYNNTGPPLIFLPSTAEHWHVVRSGAVWSTLNEGASWKVDTDGFADASAVEASFGAFDSGWLVAGMPGCSGYSCGPSRLFRSEDAGQHWQLARLE